MYTPTDRAAHADLTTAFACSASAEPVKARPTPGTEDEHSAFATDSGAGGVPHVPHVPRIRFEEPAAKIHRFDAAGTVGELSRKRLDDQPISSDPGPVDGEETVCTAWAEGLQMGLEAWTSHTKPDSIADILHRSAEPVYPTVNLMLPDPRPRGRTSGQWTVRVDSPLSMGEALEHRRLLYLYITNENDNNSDHIQYLKNI